MSILKELHFANIWEHISDIIPERTAVVCGEYKKSWFEYEQDAAKFAREYGTVLVIVGFSI